MPTDYHFVGPFGSDYPTALVGEGRRIGADPEPDEVILAIVAAPSWDAARTLYTAAKNAGIERTVGSKHSKPWANGYWHFPGIETYMKQAAMRIGVSLGAVRTAHQESTPVEIGRKLGQCKQTYAAVKGPMKADRDFSFVERNTILANLAACDVLCDRQHAIADACRAAIDHGREAFGLPPRDHRHRILTAREIRQASGNDAEVVALKAQLAQALESARMAPQNAQVALREDIDRLRAENAELLDQNKQLAVMVESLTVPKSVAAPPPDPRPAGAPTAKLAAAAPVTPPANPKRR